MKIDEKTIIIIIVVAVAAYLIWKKNRATAGLDVNGDIDISDTTATGYDKNNLEDVIKVAFNGDTYASLFAEKSRKVYRNNTANMTDQAKYQEKADLKGYTFAQMAVIDGAYIECFKKQSDGTWVPRDDAHLAYFNKVVSRVRGM